MVNGRLWEVIGEYLYLYEYYPSIIVCPGTGKLIVGQHSVNARPIHPLDVPPPANNRWAAPQGLQAARPPTAAEVIDSQIAGEFTGWDGNTVFRLMNGQIWQQASYAYTHHYDFMPKILITFGIYSPQLAALL